jgi:hypothetical protein
VARGERIARARELTNMKSPFAVRSRTWRKKSERACAKAECT